MDMGRHVGLWAWRLRALQEIGETAFPPFFNYTMRGGYCGVPHDTSIDLYNYMLYINRMYSKRGEWVGYPHGISRPIVHCLSKWYLVYMQYVYVLCINVCISCVQVFN